MSDESFAKAMETMYVGDLSHATEVVLTGRRRVRLNQRREPRRQQPLARTHGTGGRVAAGALGIGSAVGAAIGVEGAASRARQLTRGFSRRD